MKILELQVSDDIASKIEQAARERGVSVEDLVRLSVEEKLSRDAEFERASQTILGEER